MDPDSPGGAVRLADGKLLSKIDDQTAESTVDCRRGQGAAMRNKEFSKFEPISRNERVRTPGESSELNPDAPIACRLKVVRGPATKGSIE